MKKLITWLVLTALLLSCTGMAEVANGIVLDLKLAYLGEQLADLTALLGVDSDDRFNAALEGTIDGDEGGISLQIGQESLTLSLGNGQYCYSVAYETLLPLIADAMDGAFDAEQLTGLLTYTGYESDLSLLEYILSGELSRLGSFILGAGILTQKDEGGILFKADFEQLRELFAAYLSDLSNDTSVLSAFTSLGIWQLFGAELAPEQLQYGLSSCVQALAAVTAPTDLSLELETDAEGMVSARIHYLDEDSNELLLTVASRYATRAVTYNEVLRYEFQLDLTVPVYKNNNNELHISGYVSQRGDVQLDAEYKSFTTGNRHITLNYFNNGDGSLLRSIFGITYEATNYNGQPAIQLAFSNNNGRFNFSASGSCNKRIDSGLYYLQYGVTLNSNNGYGLT